MAKFSELLKRRKEITAQVEALNAEAHEIDLVLHDALNTFIQAFDRVNTQNQDTITLVSVPPSWPSPLTESPPRIRRMRPVFRSRDTTLAGQIAAVLEEEERPMKPSEIYTKLQKRGVHVNGKKPVNNVSAHLSNSDKFTRAGGGWVLREPKLVSGKTNAPSDIFR